MARSPILAMLWRILKALAVGLATAMLVATFWILVQLAVVVLTLHGMATTGSGGIGAISAPILSPVTSVICFVVGFVWQFWRSGRPKFARLEGS